MNFLQRAKHRRRVRQVQRENLARLASLDYHLAMSRLDGTIVTLEHTHTELRVHPPDRCAGEHCTVHNRSAHSMRSFPQHWRSDRGIMERICKHGVGHPDPDSPWPKDSHEWVHGCDGCCAGSRQR